MRLLTLFFLILSTFSFAAVKCADFDTQAQAQKFFLAKKPGYKRLDRDHDGKHVNASKAAATTTNLLANVGVNGMRNNKKRCHFEYIDEYK